MLIHCNILGEKTLNTGFCAFLSVCYMPLQREEFTREPTLWKKLCSAIREGVTVDNCCDLFAAVYCLCGDDMEEDSLLEQGGQTQVVVR